MKKNQVTKNSFSAVAVLSLILFTAFGFLSCDDPVEDDALAAPSKIMISVVNDHTFEISWQDNSDDEDGFRISRLAAHEDEAILVDVGADVVSYVDTGLVFLNAYTYKVAAFQGDVVSAFSSGTVAPTDFPPPNVVVKAVHETKILLTWNDIWGYVDGFEVLRRDSTDEVYNKIADLAADADQYLDEAVDYDVNYYYILVAVTEHNSSARTLPAANTRIVAPDEVNSQYVNSDTVRVTWLDNCIYETTQILEFDDGSGMLPLAVLDPNVVEYFHAVSSTELSYQYQVSATTENYQSDFETGNLLGAWFSFNSIQGGDYFFGSAGDTLSDLGTDYQMLNFEVTNTQFIDYLNFAIASGTISIDGDIVTGQYAGDASWAAGAYTFYELDESDTTRIYYTEGAFSIESDHKSFPVNYVSWFGADAFAAYYDAQLPTRNEWEKAARDLSGDDYPWGESLESCADANYVDCGEVLKQVGGRAASENFDDLFDLIGNVSEWTDSFADAGSERVVKGGSYLSQANALEAWRQGLLDPATTAADVGFRIIKY